MIYNQQLSQKNSKLHPNVSFVNIKQEEEEDRKVNWDDDRHMNERFVTHVLGKICDKMQTLTGNQFFLENINWTSKRKYGRVKSTYKLGCEVCTKVGHAGETCPSRPEDSNSKKKPKVSGSEESDAKKTAT